MKLLLISPIKIAGDKMPLAIRIPQLSLQIIKAFTPNDWEVKIIEEEIIEINVNEDCNLVAISCTTASAPRAYQISKEFQNRGKTVILGGIHPSVMPEEALHHADAIVIGEAETVWKRVLEDFKNNNLKHVYKGGPANLNEFPIIRFTKTKKKNFLNVLPVMTSRGCPYSCEFCTVNKIYGKHVRHVPVNRVIEYIKANQNITNNFGFLDDNIVGNRRYAKELFKALIPLKINWAGQSSISFADDEEMMKLAAKSGCKLLFFGLESVVPDTLGTMIKSKSLEKTSVAIQKIKDLGIAFHGSVIFGFDTDNEGVFDNTLDFLMKNKVHSVNFNILTPYPGTAIFERFKQQGRIFTFDWHKYNHNEIVFHPKNMTANELMQKSLEVKKEFYSRGSILKRFTHYLKHPLIYFGVNKALQKTVKDEAKRRKSISKQKQKPFIPTPAFASKIYTK